MIAVMKTVPHSCCRLHRLVVRISWFSYVAVMLLIIPVNSAFAQAAPAGPKVGGRIMYDVAVYDSDDVKLNNGGELRRARIFVSGKLEGDWFYKLQYDFTGSGAGGIRDAYIGYSGISFLDSIRIGHFTEYGCLEDTTSSKYMVFINRSQPVLAFVPATRRLGVGADSHGDGWYAGAGVFGEAADVDSSEDSGAGLSGRFVWIPLSEERNTVHLGIWGQLRTPTSGETASYSARPEAHVDDTKLVDTGVISNVNQTAMYGIEAAWIIGSASLQGEYLAAVVDRDGFGVEHYDGAYIAATWFLTGESLAYDTEGAYLGRVKPLNPLGAGGVGAVAIACRFSTLDLDDSISGGTEDNITVGLNWHPTARTRFMLNYVNAQASVEGVDTTVDVVQIRSQIDF